MEDFSHISFGDESTIPIFELMKNINYPLLYYKIGQEAVLGILVGTPYQVVEKDLAAVRKLMTDYLQKDYKKYDYIPYSNIEEPRLKTIEVKIRPTYRNKKGAFPLPDLVKVNMPVVFGETGNGDYEAHLPLFQESFYFYDARQLRSLVNHFTTGLLNNLSPDQLYRHMMYKKPALDIITLKVNFERDLKRGFGMWEPNYERLNQLSVQYPFSKSLRKNISAFPEAAWELDDKIAEVIDKLFKLRTNLLIVGNHGVGKSAVLTQAIKKITSQTKKLKFQITFWQIMAQRITATAKYFGEWQETCEELIGELSQANGILWVVDVIRLLQIGGKGAEDSVAAFMLSFLQQGKLQIVGEVTEQELESIQRLLPGFAENFQLVKIEELPEKKVQSVLNKFADYARMNLKINIDQDGLSLAYRLLDRYFPYENFPGKAVKFLGRCVGEAQINEVTEVTKQDIIRTFIDQTGLPELFLRDEMLLDQKELRQYFDARIIGQPKALDRLCNIVKIFKAGLNNPAKPISTLIFAGPTGVGKTASAKAISDYFFGKGQKGSPLIRIDMSEFQHPGQISRFIGAGREVGKLVQEIREKPFAVLLLDEVEKAAPSIFDALLTLLDEGILVDAFGRVTNFRNCIIIMTTNLGASNRQSIGFKNTEDEEASYLSAIGRFFRPEFVNRIDGIVMFNSLNKNDIYKITAKELRELKQREGFIKRGLSLQFSQKIHDYLADIGFDERFGARPLQRAIEQTIVNPMATWLLENPEVKDTKLLIDYDSGVIVTKGN
ncbi:MAG: ATP-dependent Clp protease ATP-binding subunit ClpC [Saprospiraceae bacterium]